MTQNGAKRGVKIHRTKYTKQREWTETEGVREIERERKGAQERPGEEQDRSLKVLEQEHR